LTRTKEEVALVLRLSHEGLNHCQIARRTGIPRCTVRDWVNGQVPRRAHRKKPGCPRCGHDPHDFAGLPQQEYVYLLGMYLGDGYIVATTKGVYRLRIFLDMACPGIIRECAAAMQVVLPDNRIDIRQTQPTHNCVHVGVYSRALPCLFPQHGPGMKHTRPIFPSDWQQLLVDEDPRPLIRGLIHSDGCRVINKSMGHKYLRYMFRNKSRDIRNIFKDACWQLGIPYKQSREDTISISRREGIEILDSFVGPKY
jgi:Homeodomain-like domain-containing protein